MPGRDKASNFLGEAKNLARNGFYREALRLYQNVWAQKPEERVALYGVAACLFRLRNLRQAEYHVRLLLEKSPDFPKAKRLLELIEQSRRQRGEYQRYTLLEEYRDNYEDEDLHGEPFEEQLPERGLEDSGGGASR